MCVGGNSLVTQLIMSQNCMSGSSVQCVSMTSTFLVFSLFALYSAPYNSLLVSQQLSPAFLFHRHTSSLLYHVKYWQRETLDILDNIWRVHYLIHWLAQAALIFSTLKQTGKESKQKIYVRTGEGGNEIEDPHLPFCNTSNPYIAAFLFSCMCQVF